MALFTARVELHDATWSDYARLHEEMKRRGFGVTITSDKGTRYQLPPAEYSYDGAISRQELLTNAKQAASLVGRSFAVVITEAVGVTWDGLQPV